MRVWITSFLVLFGMAELYEWVKHFTLPLPVYILGGAFLAIASNYERRGGFLWPHPDEQLADSKDRIPQGTSLPNPPNYSSVSPSQSKFTQQTSGNSQEAKPISFTIRRSTNQKLED